MSTRWLRELAPGLEDDPAALAERLTTYGAAVEGVVRLDEQLKDIRIARVLETRPHPNADRLSLCRVEVEPGEVRSVVCGAPNVREGAYYPFAPIGASLPDGNTIRKAKIRGEVSEGMLCSERELGLGRDHTGILELRGQFTPGEPFAGATGLEDVRLEVEVTANRPDLLSHIGVARELAPGGAAGLRLPPFPGGGAAVEEQVEFKSAEGSGAAAGVLVRVDDVEGCPRYTATVIRGVRVGPSPEWLASRLRGLGVRPINNVVDATNYVLQELGQPIHAFDLGRLAGPEIVVRRARAGETLVTLDGERRVCTPDMLLICDGAGPVALAGVMGGRDSEVGEATRDLLLEVALFDPRAARATRRAADLSTDASYRFERGVDPDGVERAARRCIALIRAVAGGEVAGAVDVRGSGPTRRVVALRPARVRRLLGVPLESSEIQALLEPLGLEHVAEDGTGGEELRFRVPGHRSYDLEREVDLIEEVARRYGYDRFPDETRPFRPSVVPEDPLAALEGGVRRHLAGRGFLEARTGAFATEADGDVGLRNPLSMAEGRLRRDLVSGLAHRLAYNLARGVRDVRLFEVGTAFSPNPDGSPVPLETTRVAAVFTGARRPPHWTGEASAYDLWDARGLLEELAEVASPGAASVRAGPPPGGATLAAAALGGGRLLAAESVHLTGADGSVLGVAGRVDPASLDVPAWAEAVWAVELALLPAMAERPHVQYVPLPTQPASERDLALLVAGEHAAERVTSVIREAAGPYLEALHPFDVYAGPGIPGGSRSIAFRLRFRAPDRTLTDREVEEAVAGVLQRLEEELGVRRR